VELAAGRPGSDTVLAKLSELLFVEAVRECIATLPPDRTGWLAGLRDPHVGRALALLHGRVAHPWTVDELARQTGLSRSALGERFAALLGEPPMRYLTRWRMQLAAQRLRESHDTVARIAAELGYDSEAAFHRAFKRELGVPPAAWRRGRAGGTAQRGS
jgi:AraC-like DNA-binding protein